MNYHNPFKQANMISKIYGGYFIAKDLDSEGIIGLPGLI